MSVKAAVTPVESAPVKGNQDSNDPPLCLVSPLEPKLPFKDDLTLSPAETTAEDHDLPPHIIELFRRELPAPTRSFSHYYLYQPRLACQLFSAWLLSPNNP